MSTSPRAERQGQQRPGPSELIGIQGDHRYDLLDRHAEVSRRGLSAPRYPQFHFAGFEIVPLIPI
jgi:hypothetical protein